MLDHPVLPLRTPHISLAVMAAPPLNLWLLKSRPIGAQDQRLRKAGANRNLYSMRFS